MLFLHSDVAIAIPSIVLLIPNFYVFSWHYFLICWFATYLPCFGWFATDSVLPYLGGDLLCVHIYLSRWYNRSLWTLHWWVKQCSKFYPSPLNGWRNMRLPRMLGYSNIDFCQRTKSGDTSLWIITFRRLHQFSLLHVVLVLLDFLHSTSALHISS